MGYEIWDMRYGLWVMSYGFNNEANLITHIS